MGLAEKRAIKTFQEGKFSEFTEKINTIAGKNLEFEVKWDELAEDGMSHLYEDAWTKVYFQPLMDALNNICADDMGKEAIGESLSKVVISNSTSNYSAGQWSSFADSTLTLEHDPTTNMDDIKQRAEALQAELENNL